MQYTDWISDVIKHSYMLIYMHTKIICNIYVAYIFIKITKFYSNGARDHNFKKSIFSLLIFSQHNKYNK
jgi:hypothetical protein